MCEEECSRETPSDNSSYLINFIIVIGKNDIKYYSDYNDLRNVLNIVSNCHFFAGKIIIFRQYPLKTK